MNYGNHVEPVFREVPWMRNAGGRREFVERWHGIPMDDVGGHQDAIAKLEKQHNVTLPPSFREWIAFAHDLLDAEKFGIVMRDGYHFENLVGVTGVEAFSLMLQAEGDLLRRPEEAPEPSRPPRDPVHAGL